MGLTKTAVSAYDPAFFDLLAKVEDRHFWFRARSELIRGTMSRLAISIPAGSRVLEVGCGTGNVLRWLERACPGMLVIGVDLWHEGLRHAKQRTNCPLAQADVAMLPFDRVFHLIGIFDVLEHLEDDEGTLRRLHELLVESGWLVVTVPARPSLWSYFDEASGHRRRYSREQLAQRLRTAGYQLTFLSEFMAPLLPLVWLWRKIAGAALPPGVSPVEAAEREFRIVPGLNAVLTWLLRVEARWVARGHPSPCGLSLLAVARA